MLALWQARKGLMDGMTRSLISTMRTSQGRTKLILAVSLGLLLAAVTATAVELHVAPDGNDAWSGKLTRPNSARNDGPLATLNGARNAIRKLKAAGPLAEPVKVVVAGGLYHTIAPLELDGEDAGTTQAPISYEATKGAHPVFSGGRAIGGWQPGTLSCVPSYRPGDIGPLRQKLIHLPRHYSGGSGKLCAAQCRRTGYC